VGADGALPRVPTALAGTHQGRVPEDRIWWISTKASIGRDDLVAEHLPQLFELLLRPMGLTDVPGDIDAAITE
jgi:hypothetical protein